MSNVIKHIVEQLDIMSYMNILSYSALSGSGACVSPTLHDLDNIEELCRDMPPNQKPYNIFFMSSLYQRSTPIYAKEIEHPFNLESYKWIDKKKKKIIDPNIVACSIISCCSLIERLITNRLQMENSQFIGFILFKNAYQQARFIKHYLKIGDLFYCGEDISEDNKAIHIQITSKEPDVLSQLSVLQAFKALMRISSYNLPFINIKENEFEDDFELLPSLYSDISEHLTNIKSRDLALIGLCIADIYVKNEVPCENIYKALLDIGSELVRRIGENGELFRSGSDPEESSAITSFNALNFLSQLYYMFSIKSYHKACLKLYNKLAHTWNSEHGIFMLKASNKQVYSIKDISAIIAALLSFFCTVEDPKQRKQLEEQIDSIYNTAFVKSQIFIGQTQPLLQQNLIGLPASPEAIERNAPVFNKAFEYKINKNKLYCEADVFRADYVLPACNMLLNNLSIYCI